MGRKDRSYTGRAVDNGFIRFLSVSQLKAFDPKSEGGCNRKWWYHYVGQRKLESTKALDLGDALAQQLEDYLKTGKNVLGKILQPAQKYYPVPGSDLEIEVPLAGSDENFMKALALRDALQKPENRPGYEMLARQIQHLAGLSVHGIPHDGAADVRHQRGCFVNEEGVLEAEHPSTRVVEVIDQKTTANIWQRTIMSGDRAGQIIPAYAKTSAQVCMDVQMLGYGRHAIDKYPGLTHVRLSHVYAQTKSKGAAKRTGLVSVEEVVRRWRRVENTVAEMMQVATVTKVEEVQPTTSACDAYTHVMMGPDGKPVLDGKGNKIQLKGCGHRYYCPLSNETRFQNLFGHQKEQAMSLFDEIAPSQLPPAAAGIPSAPSSVPVVAPPAPPAPPPPVLSADAERAAIEAEKAKLLAETGLKKMPEVKVACGAPGCGINASPGWTRGTTGFIVCANCNGKGKMIPLNAVEQSFTPPLPPVPSTFEQAVGLPTPPLAPPAPPNVYAVMPPDAPPAAALIDAADPLPAAAMAEVTDPALRKTIEEHAAQHAQRKATEEAAAAAAAGANSVWCAQSKQPLTLTMELAEQGFVCVCTKKFSLKQLKKDDGTGYAIPRHKPVKKDEAPQLTLPAAPPALPPNVETTMTGRTSAADGNLSNPPRTNGVVPPIEEGFDDDDDDDVVEFVVPPPVVPPAVPAFVPPTPPVVPPVGEMTAAVNQMFGPPKNGTNGTNGTNGYSHAPVPEINAPMVAMPASITLLRSIDATLKEILAVLKEKLA